MSPVETLMAAIYSSHALGRSFSSKILGQADPFANGPTPTCYSSPTETKYFFDWTRTDSPHHYDPCAGTDWFVLGLLFVMVHTFSWYSRWLFWEPLANHLARKHHTWDQSICKKVSMHLNAAFLCTASSIFAWRTLANKDWLTDSSQWTKIPEHAVEPDLKICFLFYVARFLSDTISLFYEDRPKGVFRLALFHHCITLILSIGAAHYGYKKYAFVCIFFIDWAEPPLLIAKSLKYLRRDKRDTYTWFGKRFFEAFVAMFIISRNGLYNYLVYKIVMPNGEPVPPSLRFGQVCHMVAVLLQTYWLGLICQAVVKVIQNGGEPEDMREDDEDEKAKTKAQ